VIGLDRLAKDSPLAQEVSLADKILERPGPHSISKGSLPLGLLRELLFEKIGLFFQLFLHTRALESNSSLSISWIARSISSWINPLVPSNVSE